jgi:hypothetical protein
MPSFCRSRRRDASRGFRGQFLQFSTIVLNIETIPGKFHLPERRKIDSPGAPGNR